MTGRRSVQVLAIIAILGLATNQARAGGAPQNGCCACDCGVGMGVPPVCLGASADCEFECADFDDCQVASIQVCVDGSFGGCDVGCNPICATPTATAMASSTATGTPTNTPVGMGGSCLTTADCAPGLSCENNVCAATGAPASSPAGLVVGAGLLAAIAALALRGQRQR